MVLRLRRDPQDKRAPERNVVSVLASLLMHAVAAYLLFSLATSSSEQAAPETTSGTVLVTVSQQAPQKPAPVNVPRAAVPVPHAPLVPSPQPAAQPRSAPPHPRVLHELAKFAPTAPPNPTPAPVSSSLPNPVPTQAQIAVTAAPLPAAAPTSLPATIVAATIKAPPTAAPQPRPSAVPTILPRRQPLPTPAPKAAPALTPQPEPSALTASAAPLLALATPQPLATPGTPSQIRIPKPAVTPGRGTAPAPGPKAIGSPGPRPVAPVRGPSVARPVQALPATPRPAPVGAPSKRGVSLSQRLRNLIPTAAPSFTPAPRKSYSFLGNLKPTPVPEPTPPPEVVAATKFLYVENVGGQRWKQSYLGVAPEERYVKMYVTSVKRIGFINWCTGWVLRAPVAGGEKWIVEPNESLICSGRLSPFTPPSPEPSKGS